MTVIRVNVPPEHTPEEEAQLVADVAAAYTESTGSGDVTVEVQRPEEVDYRSVPTRQTSRWSS
jgi:phenylpyruvate tautomerase PptA (4-oxalocrotonate tautomerase family)